MVLTVNLCWASRPVRRPLAEIQWIPGPALAGMATVTGPKLPARLVAATARSVAPTKMSARSVAPNPVPRTVSTVPGGPVAVDSTIRGMTVNRARLLAVPAAVVTVMRPAVDGMAGTSAVILDPARTVNEAATPRNRTAVVVTKPDPVMVTFVPAGPRIGLTERIRGVAREEAVAGAAAAPMPARPAIAAAATMPRPAIRIFAPIWHHIAKAGDLADPI